MKKNHGERPQPLSGGDGCATRSAETLESALRSRILILDGAMGTMVQQADLTESDYRAGIEALLGPEALAIPQKGNTELLTLARPDVIRSIHRRYLAAGADIIETNTFSAQSISLADYGCAHLVERLNREAVRLARAEAEPYGAFVAGSVGPTNKTCSISPDVDNPALRDLTFDDLAEAYARQIEALVDEGVDALLIETIFDTLNAKAALFAAREAMSRTRRVPIMLSVTVADRSGRMLAGQTLEAFAASVAHARPLSVGLNCSFGAAEMKPFIERLSALLPCYVSAYPNAGLPNASGHYDQTPDEMEQQIRTYVKEGLVNIIGGCCGTTDRHIARYPALVRGKKPRVPASPSPCMRLAGLEALEVRPENNFVNIGERCNVAGSRKFLRLIGEKQYDEAVRIARRQVEDGAQVLDINMDDGLLDTQAEMCRFLNLLASEPEVARVPFMVDSSDWGVVTAALKCIQGKAVVNSISLKEGEALFLRRAEDALRYGAAVVVMAFDEQGQATTYARRIEICGRAYRLLTEKVGFPPEDIIFDPNILAICTGMPEHDAYARDFIEAARWIRANLPGAHVSGGVSNLSFSFRGNNYIREAMHAVFLYHAIQAGMDMGIVNPGTKVAYDDIPERLLRVLEDTILARRAAAADELIAMAGEYADNAVGSSATAEAWRAASVEERLATALQKGIAAHLEADLAEALAVYPQAVDIIEGPLMEGMNRVGKLFSEGKMFLPQVVKTARTMKAAVAVLAPRIEAERSGAARAGRVLMATVKGDVHDIGKNIVSVVLQCNNFEVVDLGVMVPAETIVERAVAERADLVGLSGLITPSLAEMITTVRAMKRAGLRIPVLIGGATTSKLHTALKIAPEYDGPVVWVKDASQMALVATRLLSPASGAEFAAALASEYAALRKAHAEADGEPLLDIDAARAKKENLF